MEDNGLYADVEFPIVVELSTPTTFKTILQNHSNVYKNSTMIVSKNKMEFVSTNSGCTLLVTSKLDCVTNNTSIVGFTIQHVRKTWVPAFKRVVKNMSAKLNIFRDHVDVELVTDASRISRYRAPCEATDVSRVSVVPYTKVSRPEFIHMISPVCIWKNFINDCRRQSVKNAFIEIHPQRVILGYTDNYMDRVEEHILNVRNVEIPSRYIYPVSMLHSAVTSVPKKISCHMVISNTGTLAISYRFPPGDSHVWFLIASQPKR